MNHDDMRTHMALLAGKGASIRAAQDPTKDPLNVLTALSERSGDEWMALERLLSQYEHQRAFLPVEVGDRVRVRRDHWWRGWAGDGWHGYAPMFADSTGVVTEVEWNTHRRNWGALVRYADPYRYSEGTPFDGDGRFFVDREPCSFHLHVDWIERAGGDTL